MPLRMKNGCIRASGLKKKSNIDILVEGIKGASIECKNKDSKQEYKKNANRKYIIF